MSVWVLVYWLSMLPLSAVAVVFIVCLRLALVIRFHSMFRVRAILSSLLPSTWDIPFFVVFSDAGQHVVVHRALLESGRRSLENSTVLPRFTLLMPIALFASVSFIAIRWTSLLKLIELFSELFIFRNHFVDTGQSHLTRISSVISPSIRRKLLFVIILLEPYLSRLRFIKFSSQFYMVARENVAVVYAMGGWIQVSSLPVRIVLLIVFVVVQRCEVCFFSFSLGLSLVTSSFLLDGRHVLIVASYLEVRVGVLILDTSSKLILCP